MLSLELPSESRRNLSEEERHHQEGDEVILMKKKTVSSRGDALQKPDCLHTPEQMSRSNAGSGGLLSQSSVHAENWDGKE
jgi:hypothetical protein